MSTKPIQSPKSIKPVHRQKIVIAVGLLLITGVLTMAAVTLRPDNSDVVNQLAAVASRAKAKQATPTPPPGTVASGGVTTRGPGYASVQQVLDAVQLSLDRNDLESAKVLLEAELAIHRDDSRALALQRELQSREALAARSREMAKGTEVTAARAPDTSSTLTPLPQTSGAKATQEAQSAHRAESTHFAQLQNNEHEESSSRYGRTRSTSRTDDVAKSEVAKNAKRVEPMVPPPVVVATHAEPSAPQPAMAASVLSQPVLEAPSAPQTPPAAQSAQSIQPAQPAQPVTMVAQSNSGPKTRAEVREELERARSDGDLPRFGNPDPAGPGGAMSMTVNPGQMAH